MRLVRRIGAGRESTQGFLGGAVQEVTSHPPAPWTVLLQEAEASNYSEGESTYAPHRTAVPGRRAAHHVGYRASSAAAGGCW